LCRHVDCKAYSYIDCIDFSDTRNEFYNNASLKELFDKVSNDKIIEYVKARNTFYNNASLKELFDKVSNDKIIEYVKAISI
jgi:hypothetical protein